MAHTSTGSNSKQSTNKNDILAIAYTSTIPVILFTPNAEKSFE
ncbi:hypothetical protein ABE218_07790 [Bacillus smithii]